MKRLFNLTLGLALGAAAVLGYLFVTGWFHDPQVALRALEKLQVAPTSEEVFKAVNDDNGDLLTLLHRAGVSSRSTATGGDTPLHVAIRDERWVTATLLIDKDVDLNARNDANVVPLQTAIAQNNLALAHAMFERGANPDISYDSGQPALLAAIAAKEAKAARVILHHEADPNILNKTKVSPLYLALRSGQAALVPDLLKAGADANGVTPEGQPLLNFVCEQYKACGFDNTTGQPLVQQLLSAGADIEALDPSGKHPLRHALEQSFTTAAKELLPRVQSVANTLWIPLERGDWDVAQALIEKGADVNQANAEGETPLNFAVRNKKPDMVVYLLDKGADPLLAGKEGQAAIPLSIVLRDEPTTLALLNHERAPNVDTFLDHPVSDEFRKLFTNALLDFYLRKTHDLTPLMAAVCLDQEKVLLKLIEKGANRFAPTAPRKVFPIQLAAKRKNIRIQQILIGVPYEDDKQAREFVIDLSKQRVTLFKNGEKAKTASISSGRRSHPTIPGKYVITDKSRMHHSNIYNSAKMPYFQRFSCTAMGFHQGSLPGYAASHGCVRLSMSTAKFFFKESKVGDRVTIEK